MIYFIKEYKCIYFENNQSSKYIFSFLVIDCIDTRDPTISGTLDLNLAFAVQFYVLTSIWKQNIQVILI